MKTFPADEKEYVHRFVDSLCLGNRAAATAYREVTGNLLCFVRARCGRVDLSEEALIAWLKRRHQHCAVERVEELAQMANRFLDWMKTNGHISSNPFQELRSQYGKNLAPIVRALLNSNPRSALEKLRPLPRFGSVLGPLMRQHIALMRSLGYRYETGEDRLRRFDWFLQRRPDLAGKPLPQLIDAWREVLPGVQQVYYAQQCGRILSKAQARLDPSTAIITGDPRLRRQVLAAHRRPYVYTEEEVTKLLDTARSLRPSSTSPLRTLSTYTMLLLTYCAGLRIQEVVNLNLGDVNLKEGTIEIRNTKFFKRRCLPLTPSVVSSLQDYLQERRKAGAPLASEEGLFWHTQGGRRYSKRAAQLLLTEVLRRSGIKPAQGRIGPRVHDLRHAMAGNRLLSWYKEGINPQSRLAHLSTFMGHKDINSTLVYLNPTSELLQLAIERFRQHAAHVLQNTGASS